MNSVISPVLKNNPSKLSQGDFCIRKPREIYHNIDFRENVGSGIDASCEVIFIYHIYSSEILTTSKT